MFTTQSEVNKIKEIENDHIRAQRLISSLSIDCLVLSLHRNQPIQARSKFSLDLNLSHERLAIVHNEMRGILLLNSGSVVFKPRFT